MPRLGDALIVGWSIGEGPLMAAAIAHCECGDKIYSAVSGTADGCRKLIRRKHVKHLASCSRQAELFALDQGQGSA